MYTSTMLESVYKSTLRESVCERVRERESVCVYTSTLRERVCVQVHAVRTCAYKSTLRFNVSMRMDVAAA